VAQKLNVELDLPGDWRNFRIPAALAKRLQSLLDKHDTDRKLSGPERREADALVELSEMMSLIKVRARLGRAKQL
jgi:hypothetical protein